MEVKIKSINELTRDQFYHNEELYSENKFLSVNFTIETGTFTLEGNWEIDYDKTLSIENIEKGIEEELKEVIFR